MGKKRYFWLSMGIGLLAVTSAARAQNEQWLQYHSAQEARPAGGDTQGWHHRLTFDGPQGVGLPDFRGEQPIFARWATPMVDGRGLWMAFDRTHEQGPYDLLYIDANGDGSLADESAHDAYRRDQWQTYFGPVRLLFEGDDGPITYDLHLELYCRPDYRRLLIRSGCWYEGTVVVDGQKKHCVLVDYNANGTFNDRSLTSYDCDRIRIGEKDSPDTRFVGKYIEVDGALHELEVARDGAYIRLAKAQDVGFGHIRLSEAITEFAAGGENGSFVRKPEQGAVTLPAGQYQIDHWIIERQDENGTPWGLKGSGFSEKGGFHVTEGSETELSIGEPITSTLQATAEESGYDFRQSFQGQLGEDIELTREGVQPPPPKLNIKSQDGTYDRTFSFEYG
jgi:hypothetical protein